MQGKMEKPPVDNVPPCEELPPVVNPEPSCSELDEQLQFYLGYSFIPLQCNTETYDAKTAFPRGTIYPALYKPMGVYGNDFGGRK